MSRASHFPSHGTTKAKSRLVPPGCCVTPIPDLSNWYGRSDFWRRLKVDQETGCWNHAGQPGRHPRVKVYAKLFSAHRVAYTLKHGPIPVGNGYHGNIVMHTCDNPRCCNPAHLKLGTQHANVLDMMAKGRHCEQGGTPAPLRARQRDAVLQRAFAPTSPQDAHHGRLGC